MDRIQQLFHLVLGLVVHGRADEHMGILGDVSLVHITLVCNLVLTVEEKILLQKGSLNHHLTVLQVKHCHKWNDNAERK